MSTVDWEHICVFTFTGDSILYKSFTAGLANCLTVALASYCIQNGGRGASNVALLEIKALASCPIEFSVILALHRLPI